MDIEVIQKVSSWEIACTVTSAVAVVLAVGIAAYSAYVARRSLRESVRTMRYTYLANIWYSTKEKEFENPDFIDESKTQDYRTAFQHSTLKRYEVFASICWGHAEDIFRNNWHKELDFEPTIKRCKKLHYNWLVNNSSRFIPEFIDYIKKL